MMGYCVIAGLTEVRQAVVYNSECKRHVLPSGLFSLLGHSNPVTLNTVVALTSESRDCAEVIQSTYICLSYTFYRDNK